MAYSSYSTSEESITRAFWTYTHGDTKVVKTFWSYGFEGDTYDRHFGAVLDHLATKAATAKGASLGNARQRGTSDRPYLARAGWKIAIQTTVQSEDVGSEGGGIAIHMKPA